jgi:hypothetical protein
MKAFTPEQWARVLAPEDRPRTNLPDPDPDDYEVYTAEELRELLKKQKEEKKSEDQ